MKGGYVHGGICLEEVPVASGTITPTVYICSNILPVTYLPLPCLCHVLWLTSLVLLTGSPAHTI
jgi:hypothetical protein